MSIACSQRSGPLIKQFVRVLHLCQCKILWGRAAEDGQPEATDRLYSIISYSFFIRLLAYPNPALRVAWHLHPSSGCADSGSESSEAPVDLDATDRYGFVMPPNGAQGPATPNGEPGVRERDLESKRVLKWRKMLGDACDLTNVCHLGIPCM